ncbi:rhizobactin siderophore biosynthesis protein rhbD [Streptomyces davaonensis JCM 4913]|uniref:Lysine N-acyltransferase MbtK n=1 Tax=Streptomyces davaonensis (strain DSM 101723 / JCM 4913 / KCC S-0913 / 768) TaxID=1214101 RepID=K4QTU8_STRDJ|nr:GNAT family N-acetyltransferase [Streptomyces davaonensis]CCK27026.1 rhizobactin siderophore biosynthesis protein rhbD [Streptomyces davaonensis JCM 4913]
MAPNDASTDAGIDPAASVSTDTAPGAHPGGDSEDTLDLRLPEEFFALIAATEEAVIEAGDGGGGGGGGAGTATLTQPATAPPSGDDLLDSVVDWGPIKTAAGMLHLVPVRVERDLPLISRWMNDPAVTAFWELAGPPSVTEEHVRSQLDGDGRSVPCVGVLDGTPMSYWEIYRADLDPLARHYPARPHDTGIHLLIGDVADRGRGLGSALLRAVADCALDRRLACARVIAEPDLRNTPSVAAFLSAGFRFAAEVDLPAKQAALMVRDRALRDLL